MNTRARRIEGGHRLLAIGCVLCLFAGSARAQRGKNRVKLDDPKFNYLKTPQFRITPTDSRARADGEWFQIILDYEAEGGKDGWIDEVVLEWHVELNLKGSKDILLKRAVTYLDIEDGKRHAVIYMRPGFMRRYAGNGRRFAKDEVKAYIVARVNGTKSDSVKYPSQGKSKWWEDEPPKVMALKGELFTRVETPFAPLDYDFYEHIKPASTNE